MIQGEVWKILALKLSAERRLRLLKEVCNSGIAWNCCYCVLALDYSYSALQSRLSSQLNEACVYMYTYFHVPTYMYMHVLYT